MLNSVGIAFLSLFFVIILMDATLTLLNLDYMKRGLGNLPKVFQDKIDLAVYRKSIDYNVDSDRFGLIGMGVSSLLLLYFIYFGGFELIDGFARNIQPGGYYLPALAFVAIVSLVKMIIGIPLELYNTFVIEERYGFNNTTFPLFWLDLLKSIMVDMVIGAPLYLAILCFMDKAGSSWWIWAWVFLMIVQVAVIVIYPIWIAPLFNKFTPIKEGELKDKISDLSRRIGFPLDGVFIVDGSKRSSHSNAYFSGLGKKKRVMLFDTLTAQLKIPHILAILAHEFGHNKLHHVTKNLTMNSLFSLGGLYLLSLLIGNEAFYHGLGFTRPSNYAALVIFGLLISTLSFLISPLFSMFSRRLEYAADRFAVKALGDPETMAEVVVILSRENLSNLNPHPWYSFFHYSHPAPVERVKAIYDCK